MNVLEACLPSWYPGQTLATLGPASPQYWHALIEAKKIVYADVYGRNADPNAVAVPLDTLRSLVAKRALEARPRCDGT